MDRNQTEYLQGWTSSPDGRGTLDILSSCVVTLFLCSWSVLCLNVFPPSLSERKKIWRQVLMAGLAFLGPELLFQLSLGQWCAARRSVKKFRQHGYSGWTMKHAFLASMGAFALQPDLESSGEHWVCFPLDEDQIFYLVKHGYVPYEEVKIDKKIISDKNKTDSLIRVFIVCQILWYCISCIARLCQHLAITLLEIATVGFILCSAGTYIFWFEKPMDVGRAITLRPNTSMEQILRDAGKDAREPYWSTPMDFVEQPVWSWTLYWTQWKGYARKLGIRLDRKVRPLDKIPEDNFPIIDGWSPWILAAFQSGYIAVHLIGWNLSFPTHLEGLLWHIATVTLMVCIFGTWGVESQLRRGGPMYVINTGHAWSIDLELKRNGKQSFSSKSNEEDSTILPRWSTIRRVKRITSWVTSTRTPRGHIMDVPLRALIPVTLLVAIYSFARTFIILQGFISLRALSPSAYQSVDWSLYLSHF